MTLGVKAFSPLAIWLVSGKESDVRCRLLEIPITDIKVRFRLRTPSENKVAEIAESIDQIGLMNPITLDSKFNLIAGYHRLLAFQHLEKSSIPSIIKETTDDAFNELMEVDENLKRNGQSHRSI